MLLQSLCAKCYVLVFKSKLLRQCHTTFHIHFVSQALERKTLLRRKTLASVDNVNTYFVFSAIADSFS